MKIILKQDYPKQKTVEFQKKEELLEFVIQNTAIVIGRRTRKECRSTN